MKLPAGLPPALLGCLLTTASLPAIAQPDCQLLSVLGSGDTAVRKSVSPPATFFSKNNWNTDFLVPQGEFFSSFIAEIKPENSGEYTVKMFLKYGNDTADKVYDRKAVPLENGEPLLITGNVRSGEQPYQINLLVGGIQASGDPYTATVQGCR